MGSHHRVLSKGLTMNGLGISELIIVLLSLVLALVPFVGGVLGILAFVKVNRIERVLKEKQILS